MKAECSCPPKMQMLKPKPQCIGIWGWVLWGWLCHEGGAVNVTHLLEQRPQRAPHPHCEDTACGPRCGLSPGTTPASPTILGFPDSRTVRNKMLIYQSPSLCYSATAAGTDWVKLKPIWSVDFQWRYQRSSNEKGKSFC